MNLMQIEGAIESILFAAGAPVSGGALADASGCDVNTLKKIISVMNDKYKSEMRGFFIKRLEDSYQLCTNTEYAENIRKCLRLEKPPKLTQSLLETLAIIAYMQPVTKHQIMEIRGVDAGHAVNKLIDKNLICELGRLEAPGKPILFGTTDEFLRKFGLNGISELPEAIRRIEDSLKGDAEKGELTQTPESI